MEANGGTEPSAVVPRAAVASTGTAARWPSTGDYFVIGGGDSDSTGMALYWRLGYSDSHG